ncbi:e3 ubiquitin-protein ligase Rnf220 [Trichonephila inaurata madagascariensis]|uniref:E3 ubiquitin-protein ligase Rnf220 n=1 Tax=Trichonephila inaurata madagascariensis TaxID=2747483 RepID=A0A8X6YLJ6_9ARAC|nr:e3 ubiquitin-protein ligase Rnf220 [Trichonephila inaurata madagascariensis]
MEILSETDSVSEMKTLSPSPKAINGGIPSSNENSNLVPDSLSLDNVNSVKSNGVSPEKMKNGESELLKDCVSKHPENSHSPEQLSNCTVTSSDQELSNSAEQSCDTARESEYEMLPHEMESDCSNDSNSVPHHSNSSEVNQSAATESSSEMKLKNHSSEVSDTTDEIIYVDLRRTRRNNKRKKESDLCCPVCGITLRLPELVSHFNQEVERLSKIPKNLKKPVKDDSGISTTYVQVKSNRENRLTAKVAKYAAKARKEVQCPVCHITMLGSEEEINKHVALCVQNDENSDEHIVVDDDDDEESFEEFEIGNETRIRAISLVPGGYRSLEGPTAKRKHTDEDDDLEIDVDDTMAYVRDQLRKSVLIDPNIQPHVLESRKWSEIENSEEEDSKGSRIPDDSASVEKDDTKTKEKNNTLPDHIISSLKEKIKDLGDQNKDVKCLICMDSYTKPVVSTTCWHVHCEECWLMTMGVKKLCPQCNMIVFPTDLRRIYL